MLETLIFREIRYNDEILEELTNHKKKLEQNPNDENALKSSALIYHALKKNNEAISKYEKLVMLEPNNHEYRAFLGYLYYENDELDKAKKNFEEVLDLSASEPFILFLLGNVYARQGKISEAVDCYDLAIFLDLDIFVAHIDFARKYEHMGRHKKALDEYRAAYEIDPRDEELLNKIKYIENKINNNA